MSALRVLAKSDVKSLVDVNFPSLPCLFSNYPNHAFWGSMVHTQSSCKYHHIQAARYSMIMKHLSDHILPSLLSLINIETYW